MQNKKTKLCRFLPDVAGIAVLPVNLDNQVPERDIRTQISTLAGEVKSTVMSLI